MDTDNSLFVLMRNDGRQEDKAKTEDVLGVYTNARTAMACLQQCMSEEGRNRCFPVDWKSGQVVVLFRMRHASDREEKDGAYTKREEIVQGMIDDNREEKLFVNWSNWSKGMKTMIGEEENYISEIPTKNGFLQDSDEIEAEMQKYAEFKRHADETIRRLDAIKS